MVVCIWNQKHWPDWRWPPWISTKAEDIKVIGVTELTSIADYFVIASGTSTTQVKALSDYVEEELGREGQEPADRGLRGFQLDPDGLRRGGRAYIPGGNQDVL